MAKIDNDDELRALYIELGKILQSGREVPEEHLDLVVSLPKRLLKMIPFDVADDTLDLVTGFSGLCFAQGIARATGGSASPIAVFIDDLYKSLNYVDAKDKSRLDQITHAVRKYSKDSYDLFGSNTYARCSTYQEYFDFLKKRDEEKAQRQFKHKQRIVREQMEKLGYNDEFYR